MGWSVDAPVKRELFLDATQITPTINHGYDVVIFDCNAVFRSNFPSGTMSPEYLIRCFAKRNIDVHPTARRFVFCWDTASLLPETRIEFLKNERYPKTDNVPEEDEVKIDGRIFKKDKIATDDEIGDMKTVVALDKTWNHPRAKKLLMQLLADTLIKYIRNSNREGVVYEFDLPDGNIIHIPYTVCDRTHNFGEADCKVALAAKEATDAGLKTLVCTIDWDMVLQLMVLRSDADIAVAKLWTNKDGDLAYSSASAKKIKARERVHEIVTPVRMYPDTLSTAFLLMCIGGVDYCKGFKRFGYRMEAFMGLRGEKLVTDDGNTMTFHMDVIGNHLSSCKPRLRKSSCVEDFQNELRNVIYCVLYFAGIGGTNEIGGPEKPNITIEGDSIEDLLVCMPQLSIDKY